MSNTSATGGYLTATSAQIEAQALRRFIHSVIVGVTELSPDKVIQNWQIDPPVIPDSSIDWCGFGILSQTPDANVYTSNIFGSNAPLLIRYEELEILLSFYGPNCLTYPGVLRDGLQIAQNREAMYAQGIGIKDFSPTTHVPEMVNGRYFDRADIKMKWIREIKRTYSILSFESADAEIIANRETTTINKFISVNP